MNAMRLMPVLVVLLALVSGCGFQLRGETPLPSSLRTIHIDTVNPSGLLSREVAAALERQGVVLSPRVEGVAVLKIIADSVVQEPVSISPTARVQEFALRRRAEIEVLGAGGEVLLERTAIELSREFIFDETQALGAQSEAALLARELDRDLTREVLRRIAGIR